MRLTEKHFAILRRHMVEVIGITAELASDELGKDTLDERVMAAMGRVPRHIFVPPELAFHAYDNSPLPVGFDKTISQPFIVAVMTDLLDPRPDSTVLEVGTGVGYQTSILADLAGDIWSVEVVEELAAVAEAHIRRQGYENVHIRVGDGSKGWPDHAPFDRILISAAARNVPSALVDQLAPGGRLVMPVGPAEAQQLTLLEKDADGRARSRAVMAVRFTQLETI
jgi:protein-L-isoaspartate(D-aspartate) O-methyltransferase